MSNSQLDIINTTKNRQHMETHGSQQHVLTKYPDGKIYDWNGLEGEPTKKEKAVSWLVDTNAELRALQAKQEGNMEKYAAIMDIARSQLYKEVIVEAANQDKKLEGLYIPPARALLTKSAEAAGDGQILETAQEIVRQTNYQKKVTGVFYRTEKYQAVNVTNEVPINGLTIKGALDPQLPIGHSEIGDNTTPEYTRPEFSTYEKQIFADSFRYGFGMREKSDSWFNIEQYMTKKVPGVMLKLRNEKVLALLKSDVHTTEYPTAGRLWNAYATVGSDMVANDASEEIDKMRRLVEDFEGDKMFFIAPHSVIRWYLRNTKGQNVEGVDSRMPAEARHGKLPYNMDVDFYVENDMTALNGVLGVQEAWVDSYVGPQIDVSYKDDKKPSAWEGRLIFHFNGVQRKFKSAAQRTTGGLI